MSAFRLRTAGGASLSGPGGPIPFDDDPRPLALLAFLLAAPGGRRPEPEVLLHLWPSLTVPQGRRALAGALAAIAQRAGARLVTVRDETLCVEAGLLSETPSDGRVYLAGLSLDDAPEFNAWVAARRAELGRDTSPADAPADGRTTSATSSPGRRSAARAGSSAVRGGPRRRVRWWMVGAVAALGLAAAALVVLRLDAGAAGFAAGEPVVLADVVNATADTLLDRTLQEAATVALQQSAHLQLFPRPRVAQVLTHLGQPAVDGLLGESLARDVAIRAGVRWVLTLRVEDAPDAEIRLAATLLDAESAEPLASADARSDGRAGVLRALDEVLRSIRRQAGEAAADVSSRSPPLELVTTPSLEALRAYSDGAAAWRRTEWRVAAELWDRAVSIDTGFAMAYAGLGAYFYYTHDRDAGERNYREAVRRADRLTVRERLRIEEGWASFRGDLDSALALSRTLAERYPTVTTLSNLGTRYMRLDRHAEAIAALEQALRWDPGEVSTRVNLATTYSRQRDYVRAVAQYQRAGALDSTILYQHNLNGEYGAALVLLGRADEARAVFERMTTVPLTSNPANGFRSLGYLSLWIGRALDAASHFATAAEMSRQSGAPLSEWRNLLLRAHALRVAGEDAVAERALADAERKLAATPPEPAFAALAGDALSREGRRAAAERLLRTLRLGVDSTSDIDRAAERFLAGVVALDRGRPDSALAALDRAEALPLGAQLSARRAEALRALGLRDSAAAVLGELVSRPQFGSEAQLEWLAARLRLAEWLEQDGDREGAVRLYRDAIRQWQDGDRTLPDLAAAQRRLEALLGRRDR